MSEALRLADFDDYAQPNQRQNERILELTAQRDELLEALRGVIAYGDADDRFAARWDHVIDDARAAIAKAEQEK